MMKGYDVESGFMGYIPWLKKYMLFSSDRDYKEYLEEREN